MFFYQIYAELNALNAKYSNLEEMLIENYKVSVENGKKEESLNQRIDLLEEENSELRLYHNELVKEFDRVLVALANTEREVELYKEQNNELIYNHNTMVTKINSIILELNDVIEVLNNKHKENYYFYVYFVKGGFFMMIRCFEKCSGVLKNAPEF